MQDILSMLQSLRRPRLLIRTARIGAQDYRRDACLPRVLGYSAPQRTGAVLMKLIALEAELNDQRKAQAATYSLTRHIDVLMAMMGEARIFAETRSAEVVPFPAKRAPSAP